MDLQNEQDSNAHGSGWMLVICKIEIQIGIGIGNNTSSLQRVVT